MRSGLVVALALVACGNHDSNRSDKSGDPKRDQPLAGSADPWNAPSRHADNGMPTLGERHARAERLCPTVTPYFFEVTKAGKTSHILGTRHVGVPFAKFPAVVHDALHASKLAVFEIAPDDTSTWSEPDEPIRDELGSADWAHYAELVGSDSAQSMQRATPVTAALAMLIVLEDVTAILDKQIEDDAIASNIKTGGLETAVFQDHALATLLDLRALKATVETTKDRAEMDHDGAKDLREYCAGTQTKPGMDDETRAKMKSAGYSDAELDAQDEMLVFARNRDWIPKLDRLFAQGDVFVAVGADHLIGDKGVIALLQKAGYTTKRVTQ